MLQSTTMRWLVGGLASSLLALAWPGQAPGHGGDETIQAMLGPYRISLLFAEPVTTGANAVQVRVQDQSSWPVKVDRVILTTKPAAAPSPDHHMAGMAHSGGQNMAGMDHSNMAGMDHTGMPGMNHDGMPGMTGEKAAMGGMQHGMGHTKTARPVLMTATGAPGMEGGYRGEIAFANAGPWLVDAQIILDGQSLNAALPVSVLDRPPPYGIIAGFIALNALIIWMASRTRRQPGFTLHKKASIP